MHPPLQREVFGAHTHTAFAQLDEGGQVKPQVLQLAESFCKSTQEPLHSDWPAGHAQLPETQL
jgi:hypothetical protein